MSIQRAAVIDSRPFPSEPYVDTSSPSSIKLKRIALYAFSLIAVFSALVLGIVSLAGLITPGFALLSVPTILIAGYTLKSAKKMHDYTDSDELAIIRNEVNGLSLIPAMQRHGFQNIFRHRLMTPEVFQNSFHSQALLLDTKYLIHLHKSASRALILIEEDIGPTGFEVPSLNQYRNKFHEETSLLSATDILDQFSLPDLQEYGFISSEENELLRELDNRYREYQREFTVQREALYTNQNLKTATEVLNPELREPLQFLEEQYLQKVGSLNQRYRELLHRGP